VQIIPRNAASPAPIPFCLVDATDKETPEDIAVSAVKPTVFIGGTALTGTAADIVKVNAATGQYQWTPTQAQVNVAEGLVGHGYIKPAGCAAREFFFQIGAADALQPGATDYAKESTLAPVKAKTDQMAFGVANRLDVNVTHQNETLVAGTGVTSDRWRGAP
jgi:hypothetical protein